VLHREFADEAVLGARRRDKADVRSFAEAAGEQNQPVVCVGRSEEWEGRVRTAYLMMYVSWAAALTQEIWAIPSQAASNAMP
jgi:hypothetical protein